MNHKESFRQLVLGRVSHRHRVPVSLLVACDLTYCLESQVSLCMFEFSTESESFERKISRRTGLFVCFPRAELCASPRGHVWYVPEIRGGLSLSR